MTQHMHKPKRNLSRRVDAIVVGRADRHRTVRFRNEACLPSHEFSVSISWHLLEQSPSGVLFARCCRRISCKPSLSALASMS